MINRYIATIAAALISYGMSGSCLAQDDTARSSTKPVFKGQVGAFASLNDDLQKELGFRCTGYSGIDMVIEEIVPGSKAAQAGMKTGDKLLGALVTAGKAELSLEHKGHFYRIELKRAVVAAPVAVPLEEPVVATSAHSSPPPSQSPPVKTPFSLGAHKFGSSAEDEQLMPLKGAEQAVPLKGQAQSVPLKGQAQSVPSTDQEQSVPLKGGLSVKNLKLLASYNIELIVDRSKSMKQQDCPGGLSRWDWCGQQAAALARALAPYAQDGITITTFAADHQVYPLSDTGKIVSIFRREEFQLGTRLAEALDDRLNDYFVHRARGSKPLLVAVITDGLPTPNPEPMMVRNTLINASKAMKDPRELAVAFLQIGGRDFQGKGYLADLDANLVSNGAKYDIVHAKMFDQIQVVGLAQALVDTVQESISLTKPQLDPDDYSGPRARQLRRMQRQGVSP